MESKGDVKVPTLGDMVSAETRTAAVDSPVMHPNPMLPFLLGAAVGGAAGAVVGTLLSKQTTQLVASLIGVVDRRLTDADEGEPRFDLLLQ